jgi:nucleoid-associated protein YgaU
LLGWWPEAKVGIGSGSSGPGIAGQIGKEAIVTREQKLAMIVGFSLVLVVAMLISDHWSSARKATIAKTEPEVAPVVVTPYPVAPPETLAERRTETTPSTPATMVTLPPAAPVTMAPPESAPVQVAQGGQADSHQVDSTPPVRVAQGSSRVPEESSLEKEIQRAGGQLVRGADGTSRFTLPPAVGTGAGNQTSTIFADPVPRVTPTRAVPLETVRTHSVKAGESLYQIAAQYYDNGNLWRELVRFNGLDKAGTVRVGMKIKVPSKDTLLGRAVANTPATSVDPGIKLLKPPAQAPAKAAAPKAAPSKAGKIELASYTVKKGDTLGEISLRTLGTSRRWQEIVDLNKIDDEDNLTPGSVLKIPPKKS